MRKGDGPSAAYYLDITQQRVEQKYYSKEAVKELPRVGSIIVVNEVILEPAYVHFHGLRGCFYVLELTRSGLYVCEKLYSESVRHTTSLRKKDFEWGIYAFVEVAKPIYEKDTKWSQYALSEIDEQYLISS